MLCFRNYTVEDTLKDREFEPAFMKIAADVFNQNTKPYLLLATELGNMYTASIYGCLVSYLMTYVAAFVFITMFGNCLQSNAPYRKEVEDMAGKRLLFFSYGSGLAASMFSVKISSNIGQGSQLRKVRDGLQTCATRLANRIKISPDVFTQRMKERERLHNVAPFLPSEDLSVLFPGTYHLLGVDDKHRRTYARKTDKATS